MANQTTTSLTTTNPTAKRHKLSDDHHSLLPGLPDHIAQICLSLISPSALYSVCRSWRRLIYSATFPPFRSLYTLSTTTTVDGGQMLKLLSFDPISSKWITVDSPPLPPYLHHHHHHHQSFMSGYLPTQSVSVAGKLVLIAGTAVHRSLPVPAFLNPLIFNPLSNTWSSCPPLSTPRRWCAAGALQDTVVVASGIGSHYTETVARSVEKWVFRKNNEKIQSLTHLKLKNQSGGKIQSFEHLKLKNESFEENPDENWKKIQSLDHHMLKDEYFDENPNGNWKKIQSLDHHMLKDEYFDENPDVNCEKIQSFEQNRDRNWKKIQSLKHSKLKDEYFDENPDGNCEKIQSLAHTNLKNKSFEQNPDGNWKNIQSLAHSKQKEEYFDEKQDGKWEKMQSLKHSKLCREAIDAVGLKGKLYMVNVKGNYAKEGFVYNLDSDEWAEMPEGMLGGWRGPTAAMDEEVMYMVDESRGVLRRYHEDGDKWLEVVVDERLKGAELVAAGGGRVCVVGEKGVGIVVVDVVAVPPRLWVVETPVGYEVLNMHILPRMCSPEV